MLVTPSRPRAQRITVPFAEGSISMASEARAGWIYFPTRLAEDFLDMVVVVQMDLDSSLDFVN